MYNGFFQKTDNSVILSTTTEQNGKEKKNFWRLPSPKRITTDKGGLTKTLNIKKETE